MNHNHILVVEDEERISTLLSDYLKNAEFSVTCLTRGDDVIPFLKKTGCDLILLDIMLPGMNGMDVCKEIRKFSDIPIIMITARVDEIDRLIGLELGADDYVCKPFSPREIVARVKAVLRRTSRTSVDEELVVGHILLNDSKRHVSVAGGALKLTPSEYGILKLMMTFPNRVFSRNELLNHVQGCDFEGYDRTIDSHIKNLRRKIAAQLPNYEVIGAVYGAGYKLNDPFVEIQ